MQSGFSLLSASVLVFAALGCTSSTSNSAGSGDGGGGGGPAAQPPGAGGTVWQAQSSELFVIDAKNPAGVKQETITLPAKSVDGTTGRNAELYRKVEGNVLVTYAHYDGDNVYYRITQNCIMSENTCAVLWAGAYMQFTFNDGKFEQFTQHAIEKDVVMSATTTFKSVPFPPSDWPAQMLTHDLGAAQ